MWKVIIVGSSLPKSWGFFFSPSLLVEFFLIYLITCCVKGSVLFLFCHSCFSFCCFAHHSPQHFKLNQSMVYKLANMSALDFQLRVKEHIKCSSFETAFKVLNCFHVRCASFPLTCALYTWCAFVKVCPFVSESQRRSERVHTPPSLHVLLFLTAQNGSLWMGEGAGLYHIVSGKCHIVSQKWFCVWKAERNKSFQFKKKTKSSPSRVYYVIINYLNLKIYL